MSNTKITKKEMFGRILAIAEVQRNAEMVAFLNHEIELLNRKNSAKKATPQQAENEKIKEKILEILTAPMTATEVMNAVQPFFETTFTNQRISALLRQLGEKGTNQVRKYQEKRVTYFERV